MGNSKLQFFLPAQDLLEKRFNFIDNDILRINIAIAFRYIIFLISIIEKNRAILPGVIFYSIYKNIILYTACIVESCIHFCLKKAIKQNKIKLDEAMDFEWKDETCKDLHNISEDRKVCGVIRHKQFEQLEDNTQFITLDRAAYRSKIFNKEVFEFAEKIRMTRNRIHLAALKEKDDFYQKKDVDEIFYKAKKVLDHIQVYLKSLN